MLLLLWGLSLVAAAAAAAAAATAATAAAAVPLKETPKAQLIGVYVHWRYP